jgi:hypothetical protein
MRSMRRFVLIAVLTAVTPVLAGCADFDLDKLDVFGLNEKKKLPGERRDLFPEGVPGVTQGIPPEYMMGQRQQQEAAEAAAAAEAAKTAAAPPPEEAKPKPKPKRVAKPADTGSRPARVTVQPTRAAPQAAQGGTAPWPTQRSAQQSPWPSPSQSSSSAPWPSAPPPGSFSR